MSNDTVTSTDGDATIVKHHGHSPFDFGSFVAGVFACLLVMWLIRRRKERLVRLHEAGRATAAFDQDYAELAKRTATLERIVTEPAARLDREIDALR